MKNYVRPQLEYIVLSVEERFAGSVDCEVVGSCPNGYSDCNTITISSVVYRAYWI